MIRWLRPYLRGLGGEPTVVICGASALLLVSHYQGAPHYVRNVFGDLFDLHPAQAVVGHFWWFAASFFLYFVMPLLLSLATRGSFHRNYGLGLGDWRAGLKLTLLFLLVMLPAAWVASKLNVFAGMYPLAGRGAYVLKDAGGVETVSLGLFAVYELGYMAYFVGWEFLFRGWMLNGLLPAYGRTGALLIPIAPFAVMHLGKAELEALGSIVAGLALGVLALRTRSFWYGAWLHGIVAVWMDWLSAKDHLFRP